MRRGLLLFAVRFAIGLLLIVLCSLGFALVSMAPTQIEGGIASVYIGEMISNTSNETSSETSSEVNGQINDQINNEINPDVRISGHKFNCTQSANADRCTVNVGDRSLEMTVTYDDPIRYPFNSTAKCQATYASQPVPCELYYDSATGERPNLVIPKGISLSSQDIQNLRRENFIVQFRDDELITAQQYLSIGVGIILAIIIWIYPNPLNRALIGLSNAIASGIVSTFLWGFISSDMWGSLYHVLMMCVAVGIGGLVGVWSWAHRGEFSRVLTGFSTGFLCCGILWWISATALLVLGYVD